MCVRVCSVACLVGLEGRAMLRGGCHICQRIRGSSHLTVVIIHDLSLLDTMRSHQSLSAAVVLRRGVLENKE